MQGRTVGLAMLVLLALPASAAAVDCAGLQAALTSASANTTVTVDPGLTCTGNFTGPTATGVSLVGGGSGATLRSTSGGRTLTWSNAGNARLENLTFTATGTNGGVSFTGTSTPTIDDVTFTGNASSTNGGALSIVSTGPGSITISNSQIGTTASPNLAQDFGGGVYIDAAASVTIDNVVFQGNRAGDRGGALASVNGPITISGSDFLDNHVGGAGVGTAPATMLGGAVYASQGMGSIGLAGNLFQNNSLRPVDGTTTDAIGGALYAAGAEVGAGMFLSGNTFADNAVEPTVTAGFTSGHSGVAVGVNVRGGGAYLIGATTQSDNTWRSNDLPDNGGFSEASAFQLVGPCGPSPATTLRNEWISGNAIAGALGSGTVRLSKCGSSAFTVQADNITVDRNAAAGASAFVGESSVNLTLRNSIVWGNTGGPEFSGFTPAITYSDACTGGSPFSGTGNICANPLFVDATGPAVQAASPVIDKGSNADVPTDLTTDLFGAARIANGDADATCTAVVDMGAAERAAASCTPATTGTPPGDTTTTTPTNTTTTTTPATTTQVSTKPPQTTTTATKAPPVTDPAQLLLCNSKVALIDVHLEGRFVVIRGLSLKKLKGKQISITGDHGAGKLSATVSADGSFGLRVAAPESDQTSYIARYGKHRSVPLKVTRHLTLISQKKVAGGVQIVARHSRGEDVAGIKATLLRQTGCNKEKPVKSAKFDKDGEVTFLLPSPKPPDTIAIYRATTRVNSTYTLPVVVSARR